MNFTLWARRPAIAAVLILNGALVGSCATMAPVDRYGPSGAGLTGDTSIWPNRESFRNSDPWLAEHHDQIRRMRPGVLVLNFSNDTDMEAARVLTERVIGALAESTRYHGFRDPSSPAFLEYQVVKYVDLRDSPIDPALAAANSTLFPTKADPGAFVQCDYAGLYTDAFAERLGFAGPGGEGWLNLHALIEAGIIHELWMIAYHDGPWPALEVAELKQQYDEDGRAVPGEYIPAGNGHDDTMPWSGRTFRIAFFNPHRGPGCALENFGHGLEATADSGAIPSLRRYFREFAGFDLDTRYGLPFNSFYALPGDADQVTYTDRGAEVLYKRVTHRIEPYIAIGGNVHFPPGARHHYDISSPFTVLSTMENYRLGNGPGGGDLAVAFNAEKFAHYEAIAPDCMGAWTIFWRQCMPGLDNRCVDDAGRPMKNWWPYLFY
jgi:hypothetical protein